MKFIALNKSFLFSIVILIVFVFQTNGQNLKENSFNYISPKPGSKYIMPENNIALRHGDILDNQSIKDYLDWMIEIFTQYERILKKDGVLAFNFSYTTFNPSLPYDLINEVFKHTGFRIYDTIAWKKKSAMPLSGHPNRVTRIVEMVYIFAKNPTFTANKSIASISKTGQKYFNNYYNFLEAKNNDGKVDGHEATFSTEFAKFFIDLYSKEGDIVLDNFSGTGTTACTAHRMNRRYIGIDLVEKYCEYARNRISNFF